MIFNKHNLPSGYYVYAYIRASDLSPYYIGKGKTTRAWDKHKYHYPPKDQTKIIILEHNLTELGAFAIERRMIAWYGRKDNGTGILMNKTDGGEGISGFIFSEETKKILSNFNKGKVMSDVSKEKLRIYNKGKTLSKEHCEKISKSQKGKTLSKETRKKISDFQTGKIMSEEQKLKISNSLKGKPWSEARRLASDIKLQLTRNLQDTNPSMT